jgi:hypothetical protein
VLGEPQRFEAAGLGLASEFDRIDRLIGGKDDETEMYEENRTVVISPNDHPLEWNTGREERVALSS